MLDNDVLSLLPTDSDDAIVRFFQIRVSPLDMYSIVIDNADFLDAVYQNAFDRKPDAAGFEYWMAAFENGTYHASLRST